MRYLIIGLAILTAVGVVCGVCSSILDRRLDEIEDQLLRSEKAYSLGDYAAALGHAEDAAETWEALHPFVDATVVRSVSEDVGRLVTVLADELSDDLGYARSLYADALEAVRHMRETERLTLANIL